MASEVSFQASPDKIIADFNVYEDLDKQDVMHEEQDPSAQAKYRIKMGGLGYKGDIVSQGQKDTCVESEVTGKKYETELVTGILKQCNMRSQVRQILKQVSIQVKQCKDMKWNVTYVGKDITGKIVTGKRL